MVLQLPCYRGVSHVSGARVRMPVLRQTRGRVNLDDDVRDVRVLEYPASQCLFCRVLIAELQHDNERDRLVGCEGGLSFTVGWRLRSNCRGGA